MDDIDHITLMYLKIAFRLPGCPVCRLARDAEDRYLRFLLWENVNDLETRIRISQAMGFCHRHAWQTYHVEAADWGSTLGNSIIYEDLVGQVVGRLKASRAAVQVPESKGSRLRGWASLKVWLGHTVAYRPETPLMPSKSCRACESGKLSAESAAVNLARMLADPEHQALYAESDGVCLPHLRLALQLDDSPMGSGYLIAATAARLELLQRDLHEYGRKQAWQYRDETIARAEETATERAVAFLAGSEVPGNLPGLACGS
jgi:hypothetical protein